MGIYKPRGLKEVEPKATKSKSLVLQTTAHSRHSDGLTISQRCDLSAVGTLGNITPLAYSSTLFHPISENLRV